MPTEALLPELPDDVLARAYARVVRGRHRCSSPYSCSCKNTEREDWIYFIQGDDGGPIKIGFTCQLAARVTDLQCGYPFGRLRFVGLVLGVAQDERGVHGLFAHLRLRGEWFRPGADLLEHILKLPGDY